MISQWWGITLGSQATSWGSTASIKLGIANKFGQQNHREIQDCVIKVTPVDCMVKVGQVVTARVNANFR